MISRKVLPILLTGVCIGMLFGCGNEEKDIPAKQNEAIKSEEQLPEMSAIDSGKIVASVYGTTPFYENNYPDTASLAEASSLVVYGEVLGMEYEEAEPWIYTTGVYVKVLQPVKGNCEKDDIIKVGTGQKLRTVQAYLDSFSADDGSRDQARTEFEQYADDELSEIYIQGLDQGEIAPVVGQKNLYFLEESAAFDADETYYRLNGPHGSYTEIGEDEFAGTSVIGNLSEGMYPMESVGADEIADCGAATYTLDELIGDIKQ